MKSQRTVGAAIAWIFPIRTNGLEELQSMRASTAPYTESWGVPVCTVCHFRSLWQHKRRL